MPKIRKKIFEYIPIMSLVIFVLTAISAVIYLCFKSSVVFADFFNYHISTPFRAVISSVTSIIPFSLAETVIIASPFLLALLIYLAVKYGKKGKRASIRYFVSLLSVVCYIFITFVWTYSSGYYTTSIDKKIGIDREDLSAEDLYSAAVIIIENLNSLSGEIIYDTDGTSVMPYSYGELSKKICDSYDKFSYEFKVVRNFSSKIKPIILSEPLTYTHLSGIYSFMTGESNVNVNYPDYIVVSSAAHELSHQRGIARENESNFVAFLVCTTADDPFLRYSGYLDVYGYVMNALYSADKDLYINAYSALCDEVKQDRNNYSKFFEKYTNSTASKVTDKVNDSFLQANGQKEGTKSYGMVTDLVCAYLLSENK